MDAMRQRILVVDDDARIRDLLRRYLTQEGFEVMVAEDGKANEAVIALLAREFGIAKSRLSIARGLTSRNKVIALDA